MSVLGAVRTPVWCCVGPLGGGESLMIVNLSRSDADVYQCVAYNGVPPASNKLIRVSVQCTIRHVSLSLSLSPSLLQCSMSSDIRPHRRRTRTVQSYLPAGWRQSPPHLVHRSRHLRSADVCRVTFSISTARHVQTCPDMSGHVQAGHCSP